jgi:hypothetical protein
MLNHNSDSEISAWDVCDQSHTANNMQTITSAARMQLREKFLTMTCQTADLKDLSR